MTVALRSSRVPRWLLPVSLILVLLALAGAAFALARRGRDPEPPRAGSFDIPAAVRPVVALDVQQVRGSTFTLGGPSGTTEATVAAGAAVWLLRPLGAEQISTGDWATAVGVPNEVYSFAVRQVVILPGHAGPQPDADGVARVPAGFAGHEANRDQRERPLVSGRVEQVAGRTLTLAGRGGPFTITLTPAAPAYRLVSASVAEIREGDRVAYLPPRPGATLADAPALLVLPAAR